MSKDRDSGSEEEEGKKERLIKLRDTGDENEMVAVRENENEEKDKQEEKEHPKEK
jgi:hypothetical protein